MDFITKLPSPYRHDTILTITDHDVLKASIFLPCAESIDAVGVAALYCTPHMSFCTTESPYESLATEIHVLTPSLPQNFASYWAYAKTSAPATIHKLMVS